MSLAQSNVKNMARNKTLGAPHREVVWLSRTPHERSESWNKDHSQLQASHDGEPAKQTFPDDADCASSYSYPGTPVTFGAPVSETQLPRSRRALVLNLLGFRLVLMRNAAIHAV